MLGTPVKWFNNRLPVNEINSESCPNSDRGSPRRWESTWFPPHAVHGQEVTDAEVAAMNLGIGPGERVWVGGIIYD